MDWNTSLKIIKNQYKVWLNFGSGNSIRTVPSFTQHFCIDKFRTDRLLKKAMKITCGIYLYNTLTQNILICHATRSKNGWSIPKGVREEKELPFQAAVRELLEETNVDLNKVNILQRHDLPPVYYIKQKKILQSFLIITDTDFENAVLSCTGLVSAGYPEIDKICWVTMDTMKTMVHPSQIENIPRIENLLNQYYQSVKNSD